MAAATIWLPALPLAAVQDADTSSKMVQSQDQSAFEPPVLDRDQLLNEHQRLLDEENELASEEKYAEAIKTSQQREAVLLALAELPDLQAAINQTRFDALQIRANWQWLSGQIGDAIQTSELRMKLIEAEFGAKHWQSTSARFSLDYYRKLAATDEPTCARMLELERQADAAIDKADYDDAIAKLEALKEIEAKVLGGEHPIYANSLSNLGELYRLQANYAAAESLNQRALKIRETGLGPDHPDTARSLNNLAAVYKSNGNSTAAEPLFQRALKSREKALGPDHLDTAESLNNLADLYRSQANYAVAEPLNQRALKIYEAVLGPDHPDTAISLNNLAALYSSQANYVAAEPLYQRALKITEKALGPDHRDTAMSLNNLAEMYRKQANYAAAEPLYQRARKIREAILGPDHPETAMSLNDLAALYSSQANYAAAEPLYQRALKINEKALGPDHPETAMSLNNLAEMYREQANYAAAEPLYQQAMKIYEKALGPDHPETATSLNNLASLYNSQANYAAAEPLYQRALKIREAILGPDHPDTAMSLNNLAGLYREQGNYAAAEPLYERALKINEKAFRPDHPNTARSVENLGGLYDLQGNYAAAEPLYQRALKIREAVFGPDHPDTASSLNNLATLYFSQGNAVAAEPLYQRALKIFEAVLGPDHPDTASSLNNLATLHYSQGNAVAAELLYRRVLKIREAVLGPDHPDTAASLSNLSLLGWVRDQPDISTPMAERTLGIQLRHLDATAAIQSEQQQFLMSREVSSDVNVWLTVTAAGASSTSAVFRDVLAWKGLITARQQGLRLALKDDPLFAEFGRVTQQLSTVSINPPLPPSDPKILAAWKVREPELRRAWEEQKTKLETEHTLLEKKLAVKSVAFRTSLEQRRMQPDDLVAALKAQAQSTALVDLLEYWYYPRKDKDEEYEQRIVAFVVRGDRAIVRVELGPAKTIAAQVGQWRENFGRNVAEQDPGVDLRRSVWLPLESHLEGIETVLISPDGVLAQLPWGALPGEKPGTYLLEERAIAVIPVPQMLPSLLGKARRAGPPESLLLAGDIEYGGDPGQPQDLLAKSDRAAVGRLRDGRLTQFPKLTAAQGELVSIKDWYENAEGTGTVKTLRKVKATEAAFREQVSQNQWLHLITHGFFAPAGLTTEPPPPTVAGIGAGLKVEEGRCLITQIVAAGAAEKDGRLQVGDEILSLANPDAEPVVLAGKSLEEIVAIIRGPVGTQVRLQVRPQADPTKTVEIVLTRATLQLQTTNAKPVPVHPGLLSGLAFAGANTPPEPGKDDGILTALEVSALDMNQVDTVVLSACETGLGAVAGGEGLLGLQRAFQVAGAKTVVASLWKVPDAATSRLMQRFYENLWDKKMGKLEALREAQIWMIHDKGTRGLIDVDSEPSSSEPLPPKYWAAFVLSGDWR